MILTPFLLYSFILFSNGIIGFSDYITQSLFAPLETALRMEVNNGLISSLILVGIIYFGFIAQRSVKRQ